ncbi:hypothetical protein V8G54_002947 [Vigna mungo]|uniref:Retrotransposon Copia-like N-terminal domain-containing protein n=1 Tax=Vigna mungo TaxID=3915 RepID=A0AAQ3PA47_VIGMU
MANDNSSSISNPHEPSKPFTCITLSSVTKLLPLNYLTWKLQVETLLDGYDLLKYPDGSFPAPPMTISTTVVPPSPNPTYQTCVDRIDLYTVLSSPLSPLKWHPWCLKQRHHMISGLFSSTPMPRHLVATSSS